MKRITLLLTLAGCLALSASGQDTPLHKRVTVDYVSRPLAEVLKDLGEKAGVRFDAADKLFEGADLVTCEGRDQEAGRVASRILRPRGFKLEKTEGTRLTVTKLDRYDEFKVKREEVFEFVQKPKVAREGDRVTIAFEAKTFCDVTVAIEDANGGIIRHLASGVLGENAPEPFQWNSKKQALTWDGKNDKAEYVDDKDSIVVRVSLGLKPRYEKNLYWEPKKRVSRGGLMHEWPEDVLVAAAPEGVYVFDGNGVDHVRQFDHDGNYVRTVYPFPADKLKAAKGLQWKDYPQGYARAAKQEPNQSTFLLSGEVMANMNRAPAAFALAVCGERLALAKLSLSRLATDGSAVPGLSVHGPRTWIKPERPAGVADPGRNEKGRCAPYSSAFSPDGRRLYLAGYEAQANSRRIWLAGAACMDYDGDAEPKAFAGSLKADDGLTPGVACDSRGNVYLSDYAGDQIQVYDPQAKLLKSIPAKKPVLLAVHPKTGEIYVFSFALPPGNQTEAPGRTFPPSVSPTLTVLGPMDNPAVRATYPLPGVSPNVSWYALSADARAAVDFWTDPPTIWLVAQGPNRNTYASGATPWEACGITLLQPKDGQLVVLRDFGKDTMKSVGRAWSGESLGNQVLYVNPATGKLWVAEKTQGGRPCSRFGQLLEIDPDSGAAKAVKFPRNDAEDLAFDLEGNIYLRYKQGLYDDQLLVRYELPTWREIPWDYGEERPGMESALILPCTGTVCDDESGLWVTPNGNVAVACSNRGAGKEATTTTAKIGEDVSRYAARAAAFAKAAKSGRRYAPPLHPGRVNMSLTPCLHIWDKHGKEICRDAVPGMPQSEGVAMDAAGDLYVLADPTRILGGEKYFNALTGTLIKIRPGKNKWISDAAHATPPLAEAARPKRAPDLYGGDAMGKMWVQGAEWFYGGVGKDEFNTSTSGCHCWGRSRFALDYFARSFAPEMDQFSVAALDSNGNLILRIGQYGNVDDGQPLDPKGAPAATRSIGGDEVALMHPLYVAAHTDRRLFIADPGNARIVSVKLGYHAEEKVALKDVKDDVKK